MGPGRGIWLSCALALALAALASAQEQERAHWADMSHGSIEDALELPSQLSTSDSVLGTRRAFMARELLADSKRRMRASALPRGSADLDDDVTSTLLDSRRSLIRVRAAPAAGKKVAVKVAPKQTPAAAQPSADSFKDCKFWVGTGKNMIRKVQDAVNRVGPNPSSRPVKICISAGTYYENVHIKPGQNGIIFQGMGTRTVITYKLNFTATNQDPFKAATMYIEGDNFKASDLQIENQARTITLPAGAVSLMGKSSSWQRVSFIAWDDTIGVWQSSHFFTNCLITGLTDMMWGFGRIGVYNSKIYVRFWYDPLVVYSGHLATFGTDFTSFGVTAGAVFWNSQVYGPGLTFLGQAYRASVMVAYCDCFLDKNVVAKGWNNLFSLYAEGKTIFREYNCKGPGAVATKRVYGKSYKTPAPYLFQIKRFIGRNTF